MSSRLVRRSLTICGLAVSMVFFAKDLASSFGQGWHTWKELETHTAVISRVNQIARARGNGQQLRVGIARELGYEREVLVRLAGDYTVRPLLDLVCDMSSYDIIVGPKTRAGLEVGNDETDATLAKLSALLPREEVIATAKDPGVEIVVLPAANLAQPLICFQSFPRFDFSVEGYKIEGGSIVMPWNGSVTTPRFHPGPGTYTLSWLARGSSAKGEFSKLEAGILSCARDGSETPLRTQTIDLSGAMERYSIDFDIAEVTEVAARFTFINDLAVGSEDRNVWLTDVRITEAETPPGILAKLNEMGQREWAAQRPRVGIAEELGIEDQLLRKITLPYEVRPLRDIVCDSSRYDMVVNAKDYGSLQGQNGDEAQLLNRLGDLLPRDEVVEDPGDATFQIVVLSNREMAVPQLCLESMPLDRLTLGKPAFKVEGGAIVMPENGAVTTPIFRILPGVYTLGFQARGSSAKGEFSKLEVSILGYEKDGLETPLKTETIELSSEMQAYSLPFEIGDTLEAFARLRFINDAYVQSSGEDRNVWLSNVSVKETDGKLP